MRFHEAKTALRFCFGFPMLIVICFLHGQETVSSVNVEDMTESLRLLQDNPRVQPYIVQNNFGKSISLSRNADLSDSDILNLLRTNPSTRFELLKVSKSRSKIPAVYKRYQQYYHDVKVEGGILILRETREEGAEPYIDLISSNMHHIRELDIHPLINEFELRTLFKERIVNAELVIASHEDRIKLIWIVRFAGKEGNIQWVDANSADVLKQYSPQLNHIAETPTYGQKTLLHDCSSGGVTTLQTCDESIRIFDGLEVSASLNINEWDTDYIPATTDLYAWDSDASPGALQAFHVVERIKPIFNTIGINFDRINVAISGQAKAMYGSNTSDAYIQIGELFTNGVAYPAQLYDVIAHELGHCILLEQELGIDNNMGNSALHEGISDIIGTYIESFIQGVDWVVGDDDGGPKRYLSNYVSFIELPDPPAQVYAHDYGLVIGHMFYLIVNGSATYQIPQIGLEPAMDIILDAMQLIGDPNTDYPDMRAHTLTSAALLFGVCSPHYQAVVNAWDAVEVYGTSEDCLCPYPAPSLSATEVVDDCPISVDLSPLYTGTVPSEATLVWSTDGDPWTGHGVYPIIDPLVQNTGTYYAYYYNEEDDCFSPASAGVVVDGASSSDIHIDVDTPFDTYQEIFGDIYIEDGAVLTVTAILVLDSDVDIFVEDGSRLVIDGGTLTACGNSWQGVKVAGQFDLGSYSPAGSSTLLRGYIELKNEAVIEKALVGIDGRDLYISDSDTPPGMQIYHGGGKITISSGSTIQDCGIGVRLDRYGWGSVIGAGTTGPGYPIGYEDEPSAFSNSYFMDCSVAAIYSDQNIGLSLSNNEFSGNYTDYEGYLSSITATGNDFLSPLSFIASEHPVIPGSNFTNNTFANSVLGIDGQGNTKRHIFKQNNVDASSLWLTGELLYGVSENAFSNSGYVGLFTESTGENINNWTLDNTFSGQKYAISVFGENDTEYLANCFFSTTYADLEINSGSSIHEIQGNEDQSAGNCFNYYGRIKTGNGISPFEYWTKDGYHASCQPVLNCKYPGACNGFSLERSDNELDVDCETNIIGDPPSELNCECDSGLTGCTDAIASVRTSISSVGTGPDSALLTAQYRRCLDKLIRTYIDTVLASSEVEEVIDFLSVQPEFRYRIMAYGIMTHNLEYGRASDYLDTLATTKTEEQAFVNVQKIWFDYIMDIDSFTLTPTDSMKIRVAGEAFNPLAGYARTVFYKLTGERITKDFIHTDSTITPRSSSDILPANSSAVSVDMYVWPNPLTGHGADIQLENVDEEKDYVLVIYDAIGSVRSRTIVSKEISHVPIGDTPGIYFICLLQNGELIQTKKLVRI